MLAGPSRQGYAIGGFLAIASSPDSVTGSQQVFCTSHFKSEPSTGTDSLSTEAEDTGRCYVHSLTITLRHDMRAVSSRGTAG